MSAEPLLEQSGKKSQPALQPVSFRARVWRRAILFLLSKALLIAITIFLGVFITVLIASKSGQLERNVRTQVGRYIDQVRYSQPFPPGPDETARLEALRLELEEDAGLNLPFWPRQMKWTLNALRLDLGEATGSAFFWNKPQTTVRDIILYYLPNTLLLAGASNLLIFIFGIPLALYLFRRYGSWLDKLLSMLVPISSIPSWVHAILLISIFAVELRLLPFGGMFDTLPPDTGLGYIPIVLRHMFLPVLAIFLSMFFQLVYAWRTYFMIYGSEDYVELGRAKGLSDRILERQYILRPALSYVITSFSLTLVSFWQMTMALEVVFDWPGIGWLYIKKALPNFWSERFYPGDLAIAIGIVVIFAYLLGAVVFLLDLMYVLVDPRIQISDGSKSVRLKQARSWPDLRFWRRPRGVNLQPHETAKRASIRRPRPDLADSLGSFLRNVGSGIKVAWVEVRRYPLAMLGLSIIAVLILGSIYAVVAMPYEKIGRVWSREVLTGRSYIPKLAQPAWVNLFKREKLLSALIFNNQSSTVVVTEQTLANGTRLASFDFAFDYPYAEPPNEIRLYLDADYIEKKPFVALTWITPDGRQFNLKGVAVGPPQSYDFEKQIPYKRLVSANQHLQQWFVMEKVFPTPVHYLLFVDPTLDQPVTVQGTYHLRVDGMFFESEGNLRAELALLGQVYGVAGTDYLRRDLLVPLLWGLPFALIFGLLGAFVTTVLSMIAAASGVWFGGWVDNLIQRLTEANMILPVLAISVMAHALFGISVWIILTVIVLLNIFGSPTKTFRAAFLQMKGLPYIEAAQIYGASNRRIILHYLLPRIIPVLVPQLITLIPTYVFLEATLGLFNIKSNYPTWGTVIYQALTKGAMWGSQYWVLEPLAMLLLTGLAFAMLGSALERILNPRLQDQK